MRSRAAAMGLFALLQDGSARAEECLVNGSPVSPAALAQELENGFGSLPGQLVNVPFSVVSIDHVNINWSGCADDCYFATNLGASQCGDLATTPLESIAGHMIGPAAQPQAFSQILGAQAGDGSWEVFANAFVEPFWQPGASAAYGFELGTREVIDVAGTGGPKPLEIRVRGLGHVDRLGCFGDVFSWIPQHALRFRVTERTTFTTLLPTVFWDQFVQQEEVFTLDVEPGWVLQVDVYFEASANATGAQLGAEYCDGAVAYLDFIGPPDPDGIEIFYAADPSLTLTPRSGLVYPVPEPGAGAAAAASIALLAARKRVA